MPEIMSLRANLDVKCQKVEHNLASYFCMVTNLGLSIPESTKLKILVTSFKIVLLASQKLWCFRCCLIPSMRTAEQLEKYIVESKASQSVICNVWRDGSKGRVKAWKIYLNDAFDGGFRESHHYEDQGCHLEIKCIYKIT